MEYTSRTVRSNEPGLTQEQALASLYSHYGADIRVTSVKRRGDSWVVRFDQKTAEFPPPKDDEDVAPPKPKFDEAPDGPSDGPPSDDPADDAPDGLDGPPGEDGDSEDGDKKKDSNGEILHLLHEIATALGISGGPEDKLGPEGDLPGPPPPGPDGLAPDLDAGPPPGPPGPGGPMGKKPTKLKPGEVLPSQTPVGAPAFASTREAMTMTVESDQVDPRQYRSSQAKAELEAACPGYKVEQLTFDRTANVYRALLSAH